MADTLNPVGNVYEGIWIDWSKGSTLGLTWTPSPVGSMVFTNTLALFVTLCGAHLWTIVRYIFHQLGASNHAGPTNQHLIEQQRIFRDASHALTTARLILKLAWSSRRSLGKRSFLHSYSIGLVAVIYAACFMAVEIFSNYVINAGSVNGASPVLWRTGPCGTMNETYLEVVQNGDFSSKENFGLFVEYSGKGAHDIELSFEYAQECYQGGNITSYMSCNTLKAARLDWSVNYGLCPFTPQICHNESEAVVLDSGYIDSHDDLGINSKPKDRLKYRRLTTCALLNDTGRKVSGATSTGENSGPGLNTSYAFYGPSICRSTNWTYSYSNLASVGDNFSTEAIIPYRVGAEQVWAPSVPQWNVDDFVPVPELTPENADLVLLFLSFTGSYLEEVDDLWFSAHRIFAG
ncbi:hypothetical protein H2200_012322 [Cladophialophora chaetospira]|uniref:Uncharacterized protein n=1 Tax=Cladophialophora chaetospira TaxID=386627 RepID=A0AA38WXP5_9EURO|nr:hypothetical protein H2200_012322 [Cladophialophora chaetospira]